MALRFLIESLNDDGYLDESIESLAAGLAPQDLEQQEELVHRFTVALRLLHHLEPVGVGARSLAECLTLQLKAMRAKGDAPPADEAHDTEFADYAPVSASSPADDTRTAATETEAAAGPESEPEANWEGDGSTEVIPDDG